jgi:hypothetical protein
VGSDPYRLVERDRRTGYVFRANEDYFLGRPRVAILEVPFNSDFDATLRASVAGLFVWLRRSEPSGATVKIYGREPANAVNTTLPFSPPNAA